MKRVIAAMILAGLAPAAGWCQKANESRGHGYFYFAPGVTSPEPTATAHIGGGGEGFFTRNLGVGADLGYLAPFESFRDGIGTFSPNFVARFPSKSGEGKVEPFVTGGYTLFFRSGTANGFNLGGGMNYWFSQRVGLRFEVRDQVGLLDGAVHLLGFRIGLAFR